MLLYNVQTRHLTPVLTLLAPSKYAKNTKVLRLANFLVCL